MKIVNKIKFFRMISILVGIFIFFIIFANRTFSKADIKYKEIYIYSGDTLWSIAKNEINNNKYFENKDIRDIIIEIKKVNNLDNSNLIEGQKISIPIY